MVWYGTRKFAMLESMRRFKAAVFQALAHQTRVAIVDCLDHSELSVSQLCAKVGIEQANASQHLAILRNKHIVEGRKAGNQTFYRLRDPAFGKVLAALREYFLAHVAETLELLRQEQAAAEKSPDEPARRTAKARQGARR
jgi:DNA-binding transcriptional ArsR family regulator